MEERKSMGGALVDVFDAGVTLVKSEINAIIRRLSAVAKAKGLGVVFLLAATGPLILALVFLILFVFYGLMRLGLGAWAAALLIALFSLVVTAVMVMMGIRKLGAEVETEEPHAHKTGPMTEDERLEAQYQAEQAARKRREEQFGTATAGATGTQAVAQPPRPASEGRLDATHNTGRIDPSRDNTSGPGHTVRASVEVPRDPGLYPAGENRFVSEDPKRATVRVEGGTSTVPVYESEADGRAQMYGNTLNEKLDRGEVPAANRAEPGIRTDDHHHDPALQNPVVLKDAPGIRVSTDPTYQEDIKKGKGES
ncbi:phage holin family protein [Deinococcus aerophilus]|uniref:Phage holin family protein n=1 Tax=Deinococcus aerophilus TaxID=522488 RepID=A0ABQ2GV97_9DEIO|nr:phage holin family protein [Deinococcus aerophilus]GGM15126.1 hypothetical protein GCM10010841_24530 [Deinococcus aerophilus]